ncbi:MAG: outer membrane protein assembly factor BamB family protein [Planctomycetota bacterium]|jgi:outer membrane protein assembly factor BamB
MRSSSFQLTLVTLFVCSLTLSAPADDWPQFRGPGGRGISGEADVPLRWSSEENVCWRVELPGPGNNGSPIVSGDAVFLAVATDEGRRRSLHCYDRHTGRRRWVRTVTFDGEEPTHRTSLYAGATPAADGSRVVVWHSSAGMHCYDYEGNLLWSRDLGHFIHIWGYGASPIIHGDLVVNNCGPGERTFLAALDKHDGRVAWKTDEPGGTSGHKKPWIGSWSTPVIAEVDGGDQILVSFPHHVKAYDPGSGAVLWQCDGLDKLVYTSVVVGDGLAVAMGGFHGPAVGLTLGGSGNVTAENTLWRVPKSPQRIGSGVILGKHMFTVNERADVQCLEAATGEVLWEDTLPAGGRVWSSPVAVDGRLYVTTQAGDTVVFAANPEKLELLATNPLGEMTNSTIAVSDGHVFLRTYKALYCIGEP